MLELQEQQLLNDLIRSVTLNSLKARTAVYNILGRSSSGWEQAKSFTEGNKIINK